MKPTWGTVSSEGCKLFSEIFDTVGICPKHIDDLQLLASAFRIHDDDIPQTINLSRSRSAIIKRYSGNKRKLALSRL
jgi:Asp-tRNA(Asn)/Glu-tRNA(Gln) amidotransferase A subunit family amidase